MAKTFLSNLRGMTYKWVWSLTISTVPCLCQALCFPCLIWYTPFLRSVPWGFESDSPTQISNMITVGPWYLRELGSMTHRYQNPWKMKSAGGQVCDRDLGTTPGSMKATSATQYLQKASMTQQESNSGSHQRLPCLSRYSEARECLWSGLWVFPVLRTLPGSDQMLQISGHF